MKTDEIRARYLDFFQQRDHRVCASDVLVPKWDPTVLFTPAGMNPFKEHFLGNVELEFTRATSAQKCLRTGDIENVGRTAYHHTFFEMMGNFSFGDYFKRESIHWAWEFLTDKKWLAIDPERLSVTVYKDDDEAANIWHEEVGLPATRIRRLGEHDNFWPAGAPTDGPDGVCGPCSEIFFQPDSGGECEIWNLVFTQFNRSGDPPDNLTPLPHRNIDTGMGLERMAATMQGVSTNFHIDSLLPIVKAASEVCGTTYDADSEDGRRLRRITDHVRACTMAIHENVLPGREKENYTVRRLLRRAVLQGYQMGLRDPFLAQLVPAVVDSLAVPYPDLKQTSENVQRAITREENDFFRLIENNMRFVEQMVDDAKAAGSGSVDAQEAARLFQTRGVPAELTAEVAAANSLTFDWSQFEDAMKEHGDVSGTLTSGVMGNDGPIDELKTTVRKTEFVGYESERASATVQGLGTETESRAALTPDDGDAFIVLDRTPFYARSGGQESDTGVLEGPGGNFSVTAMNKNGDLLVHHGRVTEGTINAGDAVTAVVNADRRAGICRAHSATHILHHALQSNLGSHANQRGSKVDDDYLRFDFSNDGTVTPEQMASIESLTLERIAEALPIGDATVTLDDARAQGAMMLFGEKYPDPVRMVSMGDFSKELCGGTHLTNTADVLQFEIVSETGVSAGTRRIEAVTGPRAKQAQATITATAESIAKKIGVTITELPDAVRHLTSQLKDLKKQISAGHSKSIAPFEPAKKPKPDISYQQTRAAVMESAAVLNVAADVLPDRIEAMLMELKQLETRAQEMGASGAVDVDALIADGVHVGGTLVIAQALPAAGPDLMRQLIDQIRKKTQPVAVFFASATAPDKVLLVAGLSRDVVESGIRAGDWVKHVAPIVGGGGGGKPDLAQAGGKDPDKIPDAIQAAIEFIGAAS